MGDQWDKTASHWAVVIVYQDRRMSLEYSMGSAHRRWKSRVPLTCSSLARFDMEAIGYKSGKRVPLVYKYGTPFHAKLAVELSEPIPPLLPDVLGNLQSEAVGVENSRSFEDWAADFGMDPDSRKAEACYVACREINDDLRKLLGVQKWTQLLYEVEPF